MKGTAKCYDELRAYIETIPIVDCHDHAIECGPNQKDPIEMFVNGYFQSDLLSASSDAGMAVLANGERPLEERWPILERAWKRARFTGYGMMVRRALKKFYGEDELTLAALKRMGDKLLDYEDEAFFEGDFHEGCL